MVDRPYFTHTFEIQIWVDLLLAVRFVDGEPPIIDL